MGEQRVLGSCSSCLLTPSAEQLLTRLEADLGASRGDDGSWAADACPACGRTTLIRDEREGWSFGDSGWSFEPDAEGSSTTGSPAAEREPSPGWLTLPEYAYLTGTSLEDVVAELEAGRLDHVSLFGEDRLGVLVRVGDPAPEGTPRAPRARRPRRRKGSEGLGVTTLAIVGALVLLFVGALWWTGRTPAPVERVAATTSGTTTLTPGRVSDADGTVATRPNPSPTSTMNRSHEDGTSDGAKAKPSSAPAVPASPPTATGPGLSVGPVEFVTRDGSVSAAAHITNSSGRWLPASEVTFLVLDTSGATVGTGYATVDLAPGEEAVAVADGIQLGPEPPTVGSVRAELDAAAFRAPEQMDGSLFIDRLHIKGASVVGEVVNTGSARDVVRVDCAVSASGGGLSAVSIALVQPVAANGGTTFEAAISGAVGPLDAVECSAT